MPNLTVSFAVLLFSFAVTLMALQSPAGAPLYSFGQPFYVVTVTLPVLAYRILGAVATAGSLFFIAVAFRKRWRKKVEDVVTNRWYSHYPGFLVFWLVYAITELGQCLALLSASTGLYLLCASTAS